MSNHFLSRSGMGVWLKVAARAVLLLAGGALVAGCSAGGTISSGNGGGPVPEAAFSVDAANNVVLAFHVDTTTGTWTQVGLALPTGTAPLALAVHPSGKFLYVADSGSNDIAAYSIDATTGALTQTAGTPIGSVNLPHALAIDSSGTFLYASTITSAMPPVHLLMGFTINPMTGALTAIAQPPVPANTTPIGLTFARTTEFLYAADLANLLGFSAHAATGVLTTVPGNPFAAGMTPFGIASHPAGKFVYVTNNGSDNVSGYALDAMTGMLMPVPLSPVASGSGPGAGPQAAVVEHSGKFLYVLNAGQVSISEYSIDSMSGALTAVPASPFLLPAGTLPTVMVADASGSFVYVVNQLGNNIASFLIQSNGSLNPMGTMQTGAANVSAIGFRPGHP
jgi:6-phosphogluconolactonase